MVWGRLHVNPADFWEAAKAKAGPVEDEADGG